MIKTNTRQLSEKESRPMIPLDLSKICKEGVFPGILWSAGSRGICSRYDVQGTATSD
mgnify:CR=1 FL=1